MCSALRSLRLCCGVRVLLKRVPFVQECNAGISAGVGGTQPLSGSCSCCCTVKEEPNDLFRVLNPSAEAELSQHSTKLPFSPQSQGWKQSWRDLGHQEQLVTLDLFMWEHCFVP